MRGPKIRLRGLSEIATKGNIMRYLPLMILVSIFGFMTPALAQVSINGLCCPAGCVAEFMNEFHPARCVHVVVGMVTFCSKGLCPVNRNPRGPHVPLFYYPCVNCIPRPWVY